MRKIIFFTSVILLFSLSFCSYLIVKRDIFSKKRVDLKVKIKKGETLKEVTLKLKKLGVVNYPQLLYYWGKIKKIQLKAGCYRVKGEKRPTEILKELTKGSPCLKKFTVPPGSDVFLLDSLLSKSGVCRKGEVLRLSKDRNFLKELGIPSLDGYMYPDTYYINENSNCKEAVKVAVKRMNEVIDKLIKDYHPPKMVKTALKNLNKNEILTVASIVEKETSVSEEKPLISAVIYNRLNRKMKVQCDPTVIYSLKLKGIFKKRLTYNDLKVKSPFNTYVTYGLPPHPICNPSLESIKAALYPAKVSYTYFVANGKGRHIFSKSYNQHLKNVRKLHREWQERRDL